ncbi:MAG: aryl-sulfate sulfotransferase [Alphaproteobacteria bacterium]|nr:aryl-sulfate sulfotransferase [Alphaproteobacteria bacterium]
MPQKKSSPVLKHSVSLSGHRTSVSVEKVFWDALNSIAKKNNQSLSQLINEIDSGREGNLSSAIRVYVAEYFLKNSKI